MAGGANNQMAVKKFKKTYLKWLERFFEKIMGFLGLGALAVIFAFHTNHELHDKDEKASHFLAIYWLIGFISAFMGKTLRFLGCIYVVQSLWIISCSATFVFMVTAVAEGYYPYTEIKYLKISLVVSVPIFLLAIVSVHWHLYNKKKQTDVENPPANDDEEEDRPLNNSRRNNDEEEDRPLNNSRRNNDEEDRPANNSGRNNEEEDRPANNSGRNNEEEEDRPANNSGRNNEEEEDPLANNSRTNNEEEKEVTEEVKPKQKLERIHKVTGSIQSSISSLLSKMARKGKKIMKDEDEDEDEDEDKKKIKIEEKGESSKSSLVKTFRNQLFDDTPVPPINSSKKREEEEVEEEEEEEEEEVKLVRRIRGRTSTPPIVNNVKEGDEKGETYTSSTSSTSAQEKDDTPLTNTIQPPTTENKKES